MPAGVGPLAPLVLLHVPVSRFMLMLLCWPEDTESEAEELACGDKNDDNNKNDNAMSLKSSIKRSASAITNIENRNKKPKINFERSDSEGLHFMSVLSYSMHKKSLDNVARVK